MKVPAFLGLDLGGSGAKAGVFDADGNMLGFGRMRYAPSLTFDGHSEIPIEEIYSAARSAAACAVESADADVLSMAISSQGQTFVSLDQWGNPLHPAIMWYDSRAGNEAETLRRGLPSGPKTPVIEGISPAAKIAWLKGKYPNVMLRASRYLLLPDYFAWLMTGEAVADPNTASSTGFYADDATGYSPAVLEAAEVSVEQLARIQKSGSVIGRIHPDFAEAWGLSSSAVLVTGCNDQYCGALGAGVCRPGLASETSGTCMALVTLAEGLPEKLPEKIATGRFPITRYRFFLAYEMDCGLVLDCLRDLGRSFEDLDAEASLMSPGGVSCSTKSNDAYVVTGVLPPGCAPAQIYRSTLESLSLSLRADIELMRSCGLNFDIVRSLGGGAKSDLWLQIKADITGLQIERPVVTESATLGASILARLGIEDGASLEEYSAAAYHMDRAFEPDPHRHELYREIYVGHESFHRT